MAYVGSTVRVPPKTLTEDEQRRLLRVTGEHKDGFRDHVIFSLALGTGLREHEICALDVLDVTDDGKGVRQRFALRVFKLSNPDKRQQEAILPDAIRYKIQKFLRWKRANAESLEPTDPLFLSRIGRRISVRSLLHNFTQWQKRAGLVKTDSRRNLMRVRLRRLSTRLSGPAFARKKVAFRRSRLPICHLKPRAIR